MPLSINRVHSENNPRIISEDDERIAGDLGANPFFLVRAEELAKEAFLNAGGNENRFATLFDSMASTRGYDSLRAFLGMFHDAGTRSSGKSEAETQEADAAFVEWFATVGPKE